MFTKHESRFAQSIFTRASFLYSSLFITPSLATAGNDETKPSCSLSLDSFSTFKCLNFLKNHIIIFCLYSIINSFE